MANASQASSIQGLEKKVLMIILDGYGINSNRQKNAIWDASKPHLDDYFQHYPFTLIEAGGEAVGLPSGLAGNSEVGHMNLGAGRPVRQDLVRINEAIQNDTLKSAPALLDLIQAVQKGTRRLHLMGLLSDGGVHSHINHLKAILQILKKYPDVQVFLHAFTDGRDTAQDKGAGFVQDIQAHLTAPQFHFASLQGRSIGMDRDRRWPKIKLAYDTMIGLGLVENTDPQAYVQKEYAAGHFDEFITPVLFDAHSAIQNGDGVFFFNYRPDRAIQMTLAMTWPKFTEFDVPVKPGHFLCMTPYVPDEVELPILFNKEKIRGGLSEYLSNLGKKQLKIAETEKYAHVTYFFNGGEKHPFPGEEHILIPSPKEVSTYDQKPEMSAELVTDRLVQAIKGETFDFFLVNYANSDMVGHTGNYAAAVSAIQTLDRCVGRLVKVAEEHKIAVVITADHGNSDQMAYPDGSPHTSHTNAPVPFCVIDPQVRDAALRGIDKGALKDVASTLLTIMNLPIPPEFSGRPLFH